MVFDPDPGTKVEKLMSCTRDEFETGLRRLTGAEPVKMSVNLYDLSSAAGGRPAACSYEPQPDAVLGGLVRLPRVLVTLHLRDLPEEERAGFVAAFDKTFQRGGG